MKSIKEIMLELGFNADAPLGTQKAFLKNLIAAANATAPIAPQNRPESTTIVEKKVTEPTQAHQKNVKARPNEQLAFDFTKVTRVS